LGAKPAPAASKRVLGLRVYLGLVGMRMISSWPSVSTVWATGNKSHRDSPPSIRSCSERGLGSLKAYWAIAKGCQALKKP